MRQFTQDIDSAFQNGKALLTKRRGELLEKDRNAFEKRQEGKSRPEPYPPKREDSFAVRWLVSSGDDATFICNARDALEKAVKDINKELANKREEFGLD